MVKVCRSHSAAATSLLAVAESPKTPKSPKANPNSSFADPSRATLPSTTPPNPCRSPSHRKTPLPLSRPRRYAHDRDNHNNNTANPHNTNNHPTTALAVRSLPSRANTSHHHRSSRPSTTTTRPLANHHITSHSPPATSCTSSAAKTTPTGTRPAIHCTTLGA